MYTWEREKEKEEAEGGRHRQNALLNDLYSVGVKG